MTELSPAAQAVRDAAFEPWQFTDTPESIAAAALRATVEQVLYEEKLGWTGYGYYTQFQNQLLAIADELEAQ